MNKKAKEPQFVFRIPDLLQKRMLEDLRRPHPHAGERVGFLYTKSKALSDHIILTVANEYSPIPDIDYIKDTTVGARIGASAIRTAMQTMFDHKYGCFHVHLHDHIGKPSPSPTDQHSLPGVVDSFSNISSGQAVGYMILSKNKFYCQVRLASQGRLVQPIQISLVGFPMSIQFDLGLKQEKSTVYDRQSFLGENAQQLFANVKIGIVGYGGGGSHIGQQLAHIGIHHPVIFDDDYIEASNLNRLIGGRWKDVLRKLAKIVIAKRLYKAVLPGAKIVTVYSRWQENPLVLQGCDIVVGCGDTYAERQQLEAECRRYLVPYVDIGMDVHKSRTDTSMSGQVMLSMPGKPCFWCYGYLTDENLGREAAKYGNVGGRPQVVWSNGVLASTAVGIVVELITGWTKRSVDTLYLEYDGNSGTVKDHIRLRFCESDCPHFPLGNSGPVRLQAI